MTPANKWCALVVALTLGFWAGGAAAQSDDDGGWFGEEGSAERPQLKIHGTGQYDPPPPDFSSDPPNASSEGPSDNGRAGPAVDEDVPSSDEDVENADSQQQAVREFSPHLASYGYWVDDPYYGRVWVPSRGVVGADFRPYVSGGHWELTTDDDWLWASDYPFGWVTFHYGRWAWLSTGSWGWVPGYAYAPAWVDFRVGTGGYVGWGPAPPYSVWRGGLYVSLGYSRPVPYIFCPTTYVFSSSMPRYVVHDRYRARSIAAQTYRYRTRYASSSMRVRSPSPSEARIPTRYVPTRRVVAQPRARYAATGYRRHDYDKGAPAYTRSPASGRGPSAAQGSRYGAPQGSRSRDWHGSTPPRGDRDIDTTRRDRQRAPSGASDRGWRGQGGDQRQRGPGNDGRSDARDAPRWRGNNNSNNNGGAAAGSSSWVERRPTSPSSPRGDGARSHWGSPPAARPAPPQRAAPSAGSDRRGEARRGGSTPARSPSQQRSRSRDAR